MANHQPIGSLCLAISALLLTSCTQQAKEASKEVVKEAAPSGLEGLSRPETLQALDKVASSPAIEHAAQQVAQGFVKGTFGQPPSTNPSSATDPTSQPATQPTLSAFSPQQMAPAVQSMVRSVGQEAVLASFGPEAQAQASEMSRKIARSAMQGTAQGVRDDLGPAVTAMIHDQVGPAMQDVMTRQIAPGAQQIVRQSMQGAIAEFTQTLQSTASPTDANAQPAAATLSPDNPGNQSVGLEFVARDVARGTMLGVSDAMQQMDPRNAPIPSQTTITKAIWIALGILAITGLLAVANTLGLLILALAIWRSRRTPT